jgi:hypothetical protein
MKAYIVNQRAKRIQNLCGEHLVAWIAFHFARTPRPALLLLGNRRHLFRRGRHVAHSKRIGALKLSSF